MCFIVIYRGDMIGIITSAISWKQTILFLGLPHSSWGSGPGCGRSSSGMAVRLRPHGSWPCGWFPVALFGSHFTRQCRGKMWIKHGPAKSFSDPQLRNVSKRINMQCITSSNSPGSPPPWSIKMTPEFPPAPLSSHPSHSLVIGLRGVRVVHGLLSWIL
jgi:hypothetical protein